MSQVTQPPAAARASWLRRGVIVLIAVLAVAALGYFLILRIIVRQQILSALANAGVPNASFTLGAVTPWRTTLSTVSLGQHDPVLIDRVTALYSPQTLFSGRVRAVEVDGLQLTARQRDGRLELGPLRQVLARPGDSRRGEEQDLPLESITLSNVKLRVGAGPQPAQLALRGTLRQSESGRLDIELEVLDAATALNVSGKWDLRSDSGEFTLNADALQAGDVASLVSAAWPGLKLDAKGTLSARAQVAIVDGRGELTATIRPQDLQIEQSSANVQGISAVVQLQAQIAGGAVTHVVVDAADAGFRSAEYALGVEGLSGKIKIDDLLSPDPGRWHALKINKMTVGQTELREGAIEFALDGWNSVLVGDTAWKWLGGAVASRDIRFERQTGRVEADLSVQDVELRQLLELLAPDKAAGNGRVSGELALVIDWPRIELGNGELRAEGDGRLRILDTAAIDQAVGQSAQDGGEQVRDNIVEALKDFQYTALRAQLVGGDGDATAIIKIVGHGRTGRQQPIEFDLRVRGLNKLLNAYLGIQHRITTGQ